jgi:transcriptional regulator of arginine metabolism
MIAKKARQGRILEIIHANPVASQEDLSSFLKRENVPVTQSTLSRDIRELGLVKVRGVYQVPGAVPPANPNAYLRRALDQYVISTAISGNMVVIKTSPGNAHSVGVVLDAAQWPEILGTVAGDDTIFVLAKNNRSGLKVIEKIQNSEPQR